MKQKIVFLIVFVVLALLLAGLGSSRTVSTAIEIDATAEQAWQLLTDFRRYADWNPFIRKVRGPAAAGATLEVAIKPEGLNEMDFRLTLKSLQAPKEMVWTGENIAPRVLDGEHYFRIEHLSPGRIRFSQGERYSGLLLFPAWPFINGSARDGFTSMNQALKQRLETERHADRSS